MSLPAVSCPCCNVQLPLEAWIAHTATREAFMALAGLHPSMRLPMTCLRYVGLFAPAKRTLRWERIADLLREVADMMRNGRVEWKHQSLPAPLDYWLTGMETLLAKSDLKRPLSNHNYLKAVVAGMSEQAQASAETQRLTQGRGETPVGRPAPSESHASREKPTHNREAAASALASARQILKGTKDD